MSENYSIFVHRFWTTYKPDPENPEKMLERDWVEYSPIGNADRTKVVARIADLSRVPPRSEVGANIAMALAIARWEEIEPKYQKWKAGRTSTIEGTPLAAWNGIAPEQSEVLRMRGINSVEELSKLSDSHVDRFGLPGLRDLIANAKRFVGAFDTAKAAAAIKAVEEDNAALKAELAEMRELFASIKAERAPDLDAEDIPEVPFKRGPGRPPKQAVA